MAAKIAQHPRRSSPASPAVNSSARYSTGIRSDRRWRRTAPRPTRRRGPGREAGRRSATAAGCTRPSAWSGTPDAAAAPPCTSWPARRPVSGGRRPASPPGCPAAGRGDHLRIVRDRASDPAEPRTGPFRSASRLAAVTRRRRRGTGRDSAAARRRSPSTPWADRPRSAGSRRCTSRPCRSCG